VSYLYGGTILLINLSEGTVARESTSSYAESFLGGRGINIKLLYDNIKPGVDPLGPDNVFVVGVGPLGGTTLSTGRTEFTAKSPESGLLGSSNFGGYFAGELKYAGCDHIVVTGKADQPVYIWIHNDRVEIRDASSLWGKDTHETPSLIREEVGDPETKVACIGPAGENLVRFATIQHGLGHGAGRTGMGAVMGSKNLKAIAVRGTNGLKLADPVKFLAIAEELKNEIKADPYLQTWSREGVSREQDELVAMLGKPNPPSEHAIYKKFKPKRTGCFACPVQCMEEYTTEEMGSAIIKCEMYPAWVNEVKCYDTDTSFKCGVLTQRYGIDSISSALIIKWLMELYENGIITEKDTDGIPMEWGSPEAISSMLDKMTFREGIGDVLAEGIMPAAKKIGRGSGAYANQVKGMPLVEGASPEWLPYAKGGMLAFSVGPRGDGMRTLTGVLDFQLSEDPNIEGRIGPVLKKFWKKMPEAQKGYTHQKVEGKPELVIYYEDSMAVCDILSTCKYLHWGYLAFGPEYQARFYSAGSGIETNFETLFEYGRKVRTMERAYDVIEGLTREQETLPKRFLDTPIPDGFFKGGMTKTEELEMMKDRYYTMRGWDVATGWPTEESYKECGLEDIAEDMKKLGKLPVSAQTQKPEEATVSDG
jgi:aldehyde:ferredoxin oxidoreductase